VNIGDTQTGMKKGGWQSTSASPQWRLLLPSARTAPSRQKNWQRVHPAFAANDQFNDSEEMASD
jgi:hypothetical protein